MCPNLQELSLLQWYTLQHSTVERVSNAVGTTLRSLSLCGAWDLSVIPKVFPNLTSLSVPGCDGVNAEFIGAVVQSCKSISILDIKDAWELDGDGLHLLSRSAFLSSINIAGATSLTAESLAHIMSNFVMLTELDVSSTSFSDAALVGVAQTCKSLERLVMASCQELTADGINVSAAFLHTLCELQLPWARKALSSVDAVLNLVLANPTLHQLDISGCRALGYMAIQQLVNTCPNLLVLQVAGCRALCDRAVKLIAQGLPYLGHLNVTFCRNLSDASLLSNAQWLPQLRKLDLSGCQKLTVVGLQFLKRRCLLLERLDEFGTAACSVPSSRPKATVVQNVRAMSERPAYEQLNILQKPVFVGER